jgi:zinc D-Ala-D-Ala dipeptidase
MLLEAAKKAGLVNYGYEWWHFSYGDRAWAYVEKQEKAMYGLVQEKDISLPLCKSDFLKAFK